VLTRLPVISEAELSNLLQSACALQAAKPKKKKR